VWNSLPETKAYKRFLRAHAANLGMQSARGEFIDMAAPTAEHIALRCVAIAAASKTVMELHDTEYQEYLSTMEDLKAWKIDLV
jgi:hypothetical protein